MIEMRFMIGYFNMQCIEEGLGLDGFVKLSESYWKEEGSDL